MSISTVISIAKELGLRYEFITDQNHRIIKNVTSRDPDIVYLCDSETVFYRPDTFQFDAALYYQGVSHPMRWVDCTNASIRKILEHDSDRDECVVCFEETTAQTGTPCPFCNSEICTFCAMKMYLTPESIAQILRGQTRIPMNCIVCRASLETDAKELCPSVMDRFSEFDRKQQAALTFLKENDPMFEKNYAMMALGRRQIREIQAKRFRKGKQVKLCGLKSKKFKKWNGKKAVLIGERVIKDGTIRWPVQLKQGSKSKALIKQCNLRKK